MLDITTWLRYYRGSIKGRDYQMPDKDVIEGVIVKKDSGEELPLSQVSSLGDTMTTAQLKASTKKAQEQRAIITTYVKDHLIEGTDYGTIAAVSKSGKEFKSKPTLFKPGQEKIFSLMNLTSRLEKDGETIEMLGNEPGVIAYICRVYRKGEEIAQGRGAAKVGEKGRDINSTIKIAEKRARMDACLSLGFSEFFTQDLEDPEYRQPSQQPTFNTYNNNRFEPTDSDPVTPQQKKQLWNTMNALEMDSDAMETAVQGALGKDTVDTYGDFKAVLDFMKEDD